MSQLAAPPQRCIACDVPPRVTLRLKNGADLLRCPHCGLGWWAWEPYDPAAFYDEAYFQSETDNKGYADYAALEPGAARTARKRLRRIQRLLETRSGTPPRLYEIGCAAGIFLEQAARMGFAASGAEVSPFAAARARERGLAVECASADDFRPQSTLLDVVCMWDVIEHLANPGGVLQRAAAALRPGGVLALSTGDLSSLCAKLSGRRWHLFNLPEHLFFFTTRSLRLLLEKSGCEIASITREVTWSPVSYLSERLHKTLGLPRMPLPGAVARTLVPATLFDIVGVYAIRR